MDIPAALERRRAKAAAAWSLDDQVVVVGAGEPLPKPGHGDQAFPFLPHAEYFWLADRRRPGSVLAFDPHAGWSDFVPRVSEAERVWEGGGEDEGTPVDGLGAWLAARRSRPLAVLGSGLPEEVRAEGRPDLALSTRLRAQLTAARRAKDDVELGRMRRAAAATAAGYRALPPFLVPGRTEREVQVELEAAFFRAGADATAYDTIVGGGPNAAVLHAAPSSRPLAAGELVLVDAGAEVDGYACDVTRTYPVGGRFAPEQRDLYEMLLGVQQRAVAGCRAGVEFRELHLATARDVAAGLRDLGLLRGEPEARVEDAAVALFFPHGLGHLVGLGVRDASGYAPGRERSSHPVLQYLRCDFPLEPGFVTTIEPGVYFIPALLDDPARRERHRDAVDWERVERFRAAGGIRIEDNVLVTSGAPEVLTAAIPE